MGDIFISEFLELGEALEERGVFDSIINRDSHFFINILRLKKATTPEFLHITDFISRLENDPFDVNTLINYGVTTEEVAGRLSSIFI